MIFKHNQTNVATLICDELKVFAFLTKQNSMPSNVMPSNVNCEFKFTFKLGATIERASSNTFKIVGVLGTGNDIISAIAELQVWELYCKLQKEHNKMWHALERRGKLMYPQISLV